MSVVTHRDNDLVHRCVSMTAGKSVRAVPGVCAEHSFIQLQWASLSLTW